MSEQSNVQARQPGNDSTEKSRRGAVVLFPGAALTHLLFTYGVWPSLFEAHLVAAGILFVVGLSLRWIRRAVVVLSIMSVFFLFFLVYVGGLAPTLAYLTISGHKSYIPWAAAAGLTVYAVFLSYRVRATMRAEWAQELELTPGVSVSRADRTLRRENQDHHDQRVLFRSFVAMIVVFGPVLYFLHGTSTYLLILFTMLSPCLGLLMCCVVSWWIAYAVVVRQWEQRTGISLYVRSL